MITIEEPPRKRNRAVNEYVVATEKPWNIQNFQRCFGDKDNWHLVTDPELLVEAVERIEPRYIFVPHWSQIIPERIWSVYPTVIFHMTDLPYGRGWEPLQHLIARGHKGTMVSAIQCVKELDAGDIYMKRPLSLHGSAEEIYTRCSNTVFSMIVVIAEGELDAIFPQKGEPVYFPKHTAESCRIPADADLMTAYDWIRMWDAETYPPAFLDIGNLRLEFGKASYGYCDVEADVRIRMKE